MNLFMVNHVDIYSVYIVRERFVFSMQKQREVRFERRRESVRDERKNFEMNIYKEREREREKRTFNKKCDNFT